MKVIAKIDDNQVMLQAHKDEVARIMGYQSEYIMPDRKCSSYDRSKVCVGDEIPVSEMYVACQSVQNASGEIQEAIKTHKELVANMERFSKALHPAAEHIKSKQPKDSK